MALEEWERDRSSAYEQAIIDTRDFAAKRGHKYAGITHLLYILFTNEGIAYDIAERLLSKKGMILSELRNELMCKFELSKPIPTQDVVWSKSVMRARRRSMEFRRDLDNKLGTGHQLGSDHLLFAVIESADGNLADILRTFGLTRESVREEVSRYSDFRSIATSPHVE